MKRTWRPKRSLVCEGKKRYTNRAAAEQVMEDMINQGSFRLRVYRCRFCLYFHVGHIPKKWRRST